jgi:hypothetical protein
VMAMAGLRVSADEICNLIGAGRNGREDPEDGGKPISKATLYRHFRPELAKGRACSRPVWLGASTPHSMRMRRGR